MRSVKYWMTCALLVVGLGYPTFANATLIDSADFTTDTNTGLDWLHFEHTLAMNWMVVNAAIQPGQSLDGWRFATQSEIGGLWTEIKPNWEFGWSPNNANMTDLLAAHLGYTQVFSGNRHSIEAMSLNTATAAGFHKLLNWGQGAAVPANYELAELGSAINTNQTHHNGRAIASYLVRVSAVPEPGTVVLLSLGLAGLSWHRRRLANSQ